VISYLTWHKSELYGHDYISDLTLLLGIKPSQDHSDAEFNRVLQEIGQAMRDLNIKAVKECYPRLKDNDEDLPSHDDTYQYQDEKVERYQALKSLKCWLYQCNEGQVDKTKLYKFFKELEYIMMNKIIHEIPEFDKAEW
jgi:hypothetical protein